MFSKVFLAQTGREMAQTLPKRCAYMALHFSAYSRGLSNTPSALPGGSILLLDDSVEPNGHDPKLVAGQLTELVRQFSPVAVLLDFQRPATRALSAMAVEIVKVLPCSVGVTEAYAKNLNCPVFLPPPPVNKSLKDYLLPWKKRGVYLEIAPEGLQITVTESGSTATQIPPVRNLPLKDTVLHCHYNVEVFKDKAVFTLCRYKEDLTALAQEAESLGVLGCIGLYSELLCN